MFDEVIGLVLRVKKDSNSTRQQCKSESGRGCLLGVVALVCDGGMEESLDQYDLLYTHLALCANLGGRDFILLPTSRCRCGSCRGSKNSGWQGG